ncbi:NADH-dependent [FeFe] hydrogenase, group A6 [Fusobacterium sp. PH5-44]|uniref:NADH-dependent [FeFe] hydrogenase, group A6 n=1 Tax=unclassified Fusobacterium TaxID=2648384 RepID=UPI003D24E4D7
MKMIKIKIDGKTIITPEGTTILNAALKAGINIPNLCYMEMKEVGYKNHCASCRICVVEVKGMKRLVPSCTTPVIQGMEIVTNSVNVMNKRRVILELLLSDHPKDCLTCGKNGCCQLQEISIDFGLREIRFEGKESKHYRQKSVAITKDISKCIMCRRCETMCEEIQSCSILTGIGRGFEVVVNTAFNRNLTDTKCTFCGQCVAVCPVGALYETDNYYKLTEDITNENKTVIVQMAPAVRVALGELFGMPPGTDLTKKIVAGLRKLKFDAVFDTNFAADVTIVEESTELKNRLDKYLKGDQKVKLPLFTSCCPAWVRFLELNYPQLVENLSSTKSPQQVFGTISKEIWAKKMGIPKENVVCVSIMPCVAKKYEASRPEFENNGIFDVDYSITTRELSRIFHQYNINLLNLEDSEFDNPMGESTGAADIFGRTGGVLEAATRTLYEMETNGKLDNLDFNAMRGFEEVRVANVSVDSKVNLRLAVVHGLGAARKLIEKILNGEEEFHAVEVMACKGGCIGGGGQPYHYGDFSVIKKRYDALQDMDYKSDIRLSHENPSVKTLYEKELDEPYFGKLAHKLFHVKYNNK